MIVVDHLRKQFGKVVALDDVSFQVREGEIFGLIGPDGAGKTTLLRVVSTAMPPTSGRVTVAGLDVTGAAEEVKRAIGYMPQRFALYPDLTAMENLRFFADMYGAPRAERAALIERLLGFARLTKFQSRRAANLSGGMQKKLALAATLMHRPRILLLDEPTTGVDPVSRREFWDLLTQIHLDGVTIVVATPYLDEAERCTHVGLMHRGRLAASDTPDDLRAGLGAIVLEANPDSATQAREMIQHRDGVLMASTHGQVLRLLVDRPERQAELEGVWQQGGIVVSDLRPVRPRLEDAFVLRMSRAEQ